MTLCALLVLAAAVAPGCGSSAEGESPQASASVARAPADSHTVVIVLENRELGEVIGAADAGYFDELARRGALAVDYHAVAHPSLPNYLALIGGSTFGIGEDCTDCLARGPNLATQLSAAGVTWRAYMGGMPASRRSPPTARSALTTCPNPGCERI